MVSKQVIKILIEAEEEVSKVAKKAEDAINKMGNVGSNAMEKINRVSGKIHDGFNKLHGYVDKAREKFTQFVSSSDKIGTLKTAISNAANSFGELITNSNSAKLAMEKIKSVSEGIQSKFTELQEKIKSFGSSAKSSITSAFNLSGVKEKLSSLGSSIDNLKAKLRSLNTISTETGTVGFGFLRNAASMTVGMIGYDLVNSFVEAGRAALNAQGQLQYFGKRLNMSATETAKFNSSIETMQTQFRKVNMKAVGAAAEEMAVKLKLPKSSLEELTKATAVMSSAFVKEGRTQEDAILAVSDALDGQFRRLQELGITQDMLKNNGWNGDLADKDSLLKAINKTLDDMGFTETAQDITSLDDAFQALSVAGGDLLASVLIPLTPVLVGIVDAAISAMEGIKGFIRALQGGFSGLPDWAQIALGVTALGIAFGLVGTIILSTYVPGMVASAIATMNWIATALGAEVSAITLTGAFSLLATSIWAALAPLLPFIAAAALIAVAVFEVGKAFGWWSDVGSMISAIGAGLSRLWNAFINHPDVQALISAISGALSELGSWLTWAGQQVLAFFGISTGSNWDIVRAIIDGIGAAWNNVKGAIGIAIGVFQALYNFVAPIGQAIADALRPIVCIILGCSPGIIPALQQLWGVFVEIWSAIMAFIGPIIDVIANTVMGLVNAFDRFKNGQLSLPGLVMTVLSLLWNAYTTILTMIITFVIKFASQMLQKALQTGRNFVNGIMTYIQQLPGKAYSQLLQVVSRIVSAGQQWVSNAKSQAQSVVSGVSSILSGTASAVASALSGVVDAIVAPFRDAYNQAKQYWDQITSLGGLFAGSDAAGGDLIAMDAISKENFDIITGETVHVEVEVDNKVTLDLANVPAHIDTATLIRMLEDKEVLAALTSNPDFQTFDAKVKDEILSRIKRAKGA